MVRILRKGVCASLAAMESCRWSLVDVEGAPDERWGGAADDGVAPPRVAAAPFFSCARRPAALVAASILASVVAVTLASRHIVAGVGGQPALRLDAEDDAQLRARLAELSAPHADPESRLERGAAAFASHLFDTSGGHDRAAAATPAPRPAAETEESFRSRLDSIAHAEADPESRLEDGAAAFAAHLFDHHSDSSTQSPPASNPSELNDLAGNRGRLPAFRIPTPTGRASKHFGSVRGKDWYRVNINTIVRSGYELNSTQVAVAKVGLFVHVIETRGRRARVDLAASSLTDARPVSGWVSTATADGRIVILRPSRQAAFLARNHSDANASLTDRLFQNAHDLRVRRRFEQEAVGMAKVTAMQKNLDDSLHRVNVGGLAKDLTHFGRHREEYAMKGVKETEKAGEHVVQSFEKGATKLVNAIDGKVDHVLGEGHSVREMKIPTPSKELAQSVLNALKKGFT